MSSHIVMQAPPSPDPSARLFPPVSTAPLFLQEITSSSQPSRSAAPASPAFSFRSQESTFGSTRTPQKQVIHNDMDVSPNSKATETLSTFFRGRESDTPLTAFEQAGVLQLLQQGRSQNTVQMYRILILCHGLQQLNLIPFRPPSRQISERDGPALPPLRLVTLHRKVSKFSLIAIYRRCFRQPRQVQITVLREALSSAVLRLNPHLIDAGDLFTSGQDIRGGSKHQHHFLQPRVISGGVRVMAC